MANTGLPQDGIVRSVRDDDGKAITLRTVDECADCQDVVDDALIHACASVGIEHGMDTDQMLYHWLAAYHRAEHDPRKLVNR